jgi:hypothetical protein
VASKTVPVVVVPLMVPPPEEGAVGVTSKYVPVGPVTPYNVEEFCHESPYGIVTVYIEPYPVKPPKFPYTVN